MKSLHLFGLQLFSLSGCLAGEAAASSKSVSAEHRILHAATKRSDIYRRSMRISPRYQAEVIYTEADNAWSRETVFASQVTVSSKDPILNLEEVEHHLQDIRCSDDSIKLHFVDHSSARNAIYACKGKAGGLLITSHDSCNPEGERAVYRVKDAVFADDGKALELAITKSSWQDAFDRVDISFGHTAEAHIPRRHADFFKTRNKRQNGEPPPSTNTTDGANKAVFDLTSELLDTIFPADKFLAGIADLVPVPELPIELGCKRCSTRGQLVLSQGAINIDLSQIDLIPDIFQGGDDGKDIRNVITGGFMELVADGVGATLELFARPKASGSFEVTLATIPIVGFVIPGVGRAGAAFEPRIAADYDISGALEINYGLDVSIPDGASIRAELTNIANSGTQGFPGSSITPLPIIANVTDLEILLGLAFKPTIPIGFEFTDKLKADATISMNLPRLSAKLSSNNAQNCGNSTNSTLPHGPFANTTDVSPSNGLAALTSLALIEANVSLSIDLALDLAFPFLPPPFDGIGAAANLFSTDFPIVTSCASPAKAFKSLVGIVAAPVTANYTASAVTTLAPMATPHPHNNISSMVYANATTCWTSTTGRDGCVTKSYANTTMLIAHITSHANTQTPSPASSFANPSVELILSHNLVSQPPSTPPAKPVPSLSPVNHPPPASLQPDIPAIIPHPFSSTIPPPPFPSPTSTAISTNVPAAFLRSTNTNTSLMRVEAEAEAVQSPVAFTGASSKTYYVKTWQIAVGMIISTTCGRAVL